MKPCGLLIAALVASASACSSSSGTPADAGIDFCAPPLGYLGNELHVGAGCTAGGNQCSNLAVNGALLSCAIDLDPEGSPMCIKVGCSSHEACGTNACCTGREDNPVHACVAKDCLAPQDAVCPPVPGRKDSGVSEDSGASDSGADAGARDA